jgi:type IV secretion system protein VirB8
MKLAALRKPITADALEQYKAERAGLELDLLDEILTSRRRGWQVGCVGIAFGFLGLLLSGFVVWRYSQPIPEHMLVQDKATGAVQQVSLIPGEQTSAGEATDAYWVAQFVIHHEGYNFYTAQADYDFISLTATGEVADSYNKLWGGPKAPDKVLGDSQLTNVSVSSVILDREHGIATIRYTTTRKFKERPEADPPVHWIATVSYTYASKLMTAKQRYINPLGFQVLAFRPNTEAVEN